MSAVLTASVSDSCYYCFCLVNISRRVLIKMSPVREFTLLRTSGALCGCRARGRLKSRTTTKTEWQQVAEASWKWYLLIRPVIAMKGHIGLPWIFLLSGNDIMNYTISSTHVQNVQKTESKTTLFLTFQFFLFLFFFSLFCFLFKPTTKLLFECALYILNTFTYNTSFSLNEECLNPWPFFWLSNV